MAPAASGSGTSPACLLQENGTPCPRSPPKPTTLPEDVDVERPDPAVRALGDVLCHPVHPERGPPVDGPVGAGSHRRAAGVDGLGAGMPDERLGWRREEDGA